MANADIWNGQTLGKGDLALFVPTNLVEAPAAVPSPILAAASSEQGACVIRPAQLGAFLQTHAGCQLICYDAAGLHWVLDEHFRRASETEALKVLWDFSGAGRLHDILLFDRLVWLARAGYRRPPARRLDELAMDYRGIELRGTFELQTRFAAAVAQGGSQFGQTLVTEAVRVADAILKIFQVLPLSASPLPGGARANKETVAKFGVLAAMIQVQGAIALAQATRTGLGLDDEDRERVLQACQVARERHLRTLTADNQAKRCFQLDAGQVRYRNGFPAFRERTLKLWLASEADSVRGVDRTLLALDRSRKDTFPTDPDDWGILIKCRPLLRAWSDLMAAAKVRHALQKSHHPKVHPQYESLPRVRSVGPSLASLRRLYQGGPFRPSPGKVFLVVELRDLALRALAAVCEQRYGQSRLAVIFRQGGDPYAHAGACLARTEAAGPATARVGEHDCSPYWTQVARALLFAIPQGLGDESLQVVARQEFDVDISLVEAHQFRRRMVEGIYPELSRYLRDAWGVGIVKGDPDGLRGELGIDVVTPTGRVRGSMLPPESCATAYLDLADDAAKAALYAVVAAGHRLAGFRESEFVLELPSHSEATVKEVERLTSSAAGEVLQGMVVPCVSTWSNRW